MRRENCHNAKKTYRFKQWSRVGYAVFNSIHLQVSIGFLSTDLSNKIGDKKKEKANSLNHISQVYDEEKPINECDILIESLCFCSLLYVIFLSFIQQSKWFPLWSIGKQKLAFLRLCFFPHFLNLSFPQLHNSFIFNKKTCPTKVLSNRNYLLTNLNILLNFYNDENKNHRTDGAVSDGYVRCFGTET